MRIIAKERDYYDSIQSYGFDEKLVYPREESDVDISDLVENDSRFALVKHYLSYQDNIFFIGFCGKIYPVARVSYKTTHHFDEDLQKEVYRPKYHDVNCYSCQEILDTYEQNKCKEELKLFNKTYGSRYPFFRRWHAFTKERMDKMFEEVGGSEVLDWLFIEQNVPVFVIHNKKRTVTLTKNPVLLPYSFQKKIDPYTAFQEIAMFISGVLGMKAPYMANISDIHMRDAKGFNDMSFKTRKGSKKPRKQKRA